MKKIYIVIFAMLISVSSLLVVTVVTSKEKSFDNLNNKENILTKKTIYTYNISNPNFNIEVFSNNPTTVLNAYNDIDATLTDNDTVIASKITNTELNGEYTYNKQNYKKYVLNVKILIDNAGFNLTNASLKTRDFDLQIGSLSIVDIKPSTDQSLDYKSVNVISRDSGFKTINAVVMTLKNKGEDVVNINKLDIGYYNYLDLSKAIKVSSTNSLKSFEEYFPNYEPTVFKVKKASLLINPNETITLVIPLYYKVPYLLTTAIISVNDSLVIPQQKYLVDFSELITFGDILSEATMSNVK